jgi:putative alpha-1,2-mannosidase
MKLPEGKSFTVTANNLSDENIYVKEVFLNGEKLNRAYITFDEVLNGGELRFEMTK